MSLRSHQHPQSQTLATKVGETSAKTQVNLMNEQVCREDCARCNPESWDHICEQKCSLTRMFSTCKTVLCACIMCTCLAFMQQVLRLVKCHTQARSITSHSSSCPSTPQLICCLSFVCFFVFFCFFISSKSV